MGDTVGSLTQLEKSVIIGSILGDGCLRIVKSRKNALLEINHSIRAKDYVDWKYFILRNISLSKPKSRKTNGRRIAYRFTTRQHQALTMMYKQFYIDGKKQVPEINLNPIVLAVWFMDDGSKCRKYDVYLNTQQFSYKDNLKLVKSLKVLNLKATINKDKQYFRIRIKKESIWLFNKIIEKYIVPSMRYKLSYDPVET